MQVSSVHADGDHAIDDLFCGFRHRLKIGTLFRQRACNLVHEERARHAARLRQAWQRHIVVYDDHADVQSEGTRPLRRKPEVQPVAGVVLDDQQAARAAGHRKYPGKHGIDRRRSKHVAADSRGEHAPSDETCM